MATTTVSNEKPYLYLTTDTSAANTALAVTVPSGAARRLVMVAVKYSAAPTQTGVTTELDSGTGTDYDTTLNTGTANALNTVYIPGDAVKYGKDDSIRVTAPAGGAGITSSVSIYTEGL